MHTNRFTLWAMGAERRQRLVWVTINVGAPAVRDVLAGMRAAAREAGNVVLRLVTPQTMGSVPPRVDGLIGRILERPLQSFAKRKPAVSVYSTGHPDPCRAVYSDPVAASRMAVDHLLERDLHHLRTYLATRVIGARRVRAERFEQFAADAGADVQRHEADDPAEGPGNHKTLRQLTRWLARQPLPLGVMAIDDWHALRVIEACGEAGLRVPGDVAVLGHNDDAGVCRFCDPPLSSVATNQYEIGRQAMELLVRLLDGKPAPAVPIRVPPLGVVARESTDVQHTRDPAVAAALAFIRQHLADGITTDDIVASVPASASTLDRRFRRHLGMSVRAALGEARLRRVARLLLADPAPLYAIANQTGYDHVSQMCREFKRRYGQTPTQYRRQRG